MKYDPEKHHRRSIRLKGYDYAQPGAYFVTVCTQNRECLFGDVVDSEMVLNDAGCMVKTVWEEIPSRYPGVDVDAFVVMPNHIHGIIIIVGAGARACPDGVRQSHGVWERRGVGQSQAAGQPQGVAPTTTMFSLPDVVHRFKTMTTKQYATGVKQRDWRPFSGRLWQRNYYEHVVRDENEFNQLREYIVTNPMKWESDLENPQKICP